MSEKTMIDVFVEREEFFGDIQVQMAKETVITQRDGYASLRRVLDEAFAHASAGKALFDALTLAGVWADDSQVRKQVTTWGDVVKGGAVTVQILPME